MSEEISVLLKGEIDQHRASELKEQLDRIIEKTHPKKLILDFTNVDMVDSSGIGLLLGRYKKINEYGGKLYVKEINKQTDTVFKVSGLYQLIKKI